MRSLIFVAMLTACGSSTETPDPTTDAPAAEKGHDHGDADHDHAKKTKGKAKPGAGKAKVMFMEPKDGATVKSPVHLVFGVKGMKVQPAGEVVKNTGHHHVIIDANGIDEGVAVPKDETHIHFGGGQTEADIELTPGKHTLTMQFADGSHMSYGDVMANTIKITVE